MLQLPNAEISLWKHDSLDAVYPALSEDIEVDVVIIGGGITGLTAAYLLKQAGKTVAVLEKNTVAGGTTGRTTGKVTSQHNLIYHDLYTRLGEKVARVYGAANQAALAQVHTIITKEEIACDWAQDDNYVYTTQESQVAKYRQEAETASKIGLPATFELQPPLPFATAGVVKFANQAKMNATKYVRGLARSVHGQDSFVFEESKASTIRDGVPAVVKTPQAGVIAKDVIVATNVPTFPLVARGSYCALEYPTESYIVAGRLYQKEQEGMYISSDRGQYSILPIVVDDEQWLLIGGESNISGLAGNKEKRYQKLAEYAREKFGVTLIDFKWADRDYSAYDGIPLVGKIYPWSQHTYVATAFMKWGLTNGTVAAIILRDLLCGHENQWAEVFRANRLSPMASIPRVIVKHARG